MADSDTISDSAVKINNAGSSIDDLLENDNEPIVLNSKHRQLIFV